MYDFILNSRIGKLGFITDDNKLIKINFLAETVDVFNQDSLLAQKTGRQLQAYLQNGKPLIGLNYELKGTPYQLKVWRRLQTIPYGQTITYGKLAKELSSSAQAIGNACRANPLPLIVPCHRVLAANGLGGFAGETTGHLCNIKAQLLALEEKYSRKSA